MKQEHGRAFVRVGAVVLSFCAPLALYAAGNAGEIIKYRKNVMDANGGHTDAAAAIIENKVDFKDQLIDHARAIEAGTRNVPALFPAGTETGGETRARPEVWSKRDQFEKQAGDTREKAAAFAKAVAAKDEAQTRTAFKELDNSCNACHKEFRKRRER
jgi:cytochrome c556